MDNPWHLKIEINCCYFTCDFVWPYHTARCNADSTGEQLVGHCQEPRSAALLDRRDEPSVLGDVAVSIEQVRSRYPDVVEGQFCVVNPVEAHLVTHVLYGDAGNRLRDTLIVRICCYICF